MNGISIAGEPKIVRRGIRLTVNQNNFLRELAKTRGCKPNAILGQLIDEARQQKSSAQVFEDGRTALTK